MHSSSVRLSCESTATVPLVGGLNTFCAVLSAAAVVGADVVAGCVPPQPEKAVSIRARAAVMVTIRFTLSLLCYVRPRKPRELMKRTLLQML